MGNGGSNDGFSLVGFYFLFTDIFIWRGHADVYPGYLGCALLVSVGLNCLWFFLSFFFILGNYVWQYIGVVNIVYIKAHSTLFLLLYFVWLIKLSCYQFRISTAPFFWCSISLLARAGYKFYFCRCGFGWWLFLD